MKPALSSFFSELIAVVLGIVITFAGQGMIDRAHDRKEVRSALQLVRTELISNRDDISELRPSWSRCSSLRVTSRTTPRSCRTSTPWTALISVH